MGRICTVPTSPGRIKWFALPDGNAFEGDEVADVDAH